MKIAFFSDTYSYISGVATSIANFSYGLVNSGHQVTFFAPRGKGVKVQLPRQVKMEWVSGVTLDRLYPNFQAVRPQIPATFRKVKDFNPDIIHFHTPVILGAEAIVYAKLLKKPLVGTFHGYFMEPEYMKIFKIDRFERGVQFLGRFLWKYNNFIYNKCNLVISPSHFSKKDLQQHGLKTKVAVVNNPIDLSRLKKVNQKQITHLQKKYWLGDKVLIYVGRLSQEKSLNLLILAFKKVVQALPNAQLLLIGSGPVEKELRQLAIGLGIERSVVFTGEIDYQSLLTKGYYQLGKVFASASTSECLPMTFIEAMAFGLPIVCARARGNIEMVKGNGILCLPEDLNQFSRGMIDYLKNEKKRQSAARQSVQLANQYGVEKKTTDLLNRYRTVIR